MVRVDSGVESGSVVSPHYDPMLAKVIVHAPTRAEAAAALAATLARARIHGVTTNRDLLVRTLRQPAFMAGETDTGFLDRHGLDVLATPLADAGGGPTGTRWPRPWPAQARRRAGAPVQAGVPSGFRNNASALQEVTLPPRRRGSSRWATGSTGSARDLGAVEPSTATRWRSTRWRHARIGGRLTTDGVTRRYRVEQVGPTAFVDGPDGSSALVEQERFPIAADQVAAGSAVAPMPGGVVRVAVSVGDAVRAGQRWWCWRR